ncbi:thyroid stimulating hormone subunit beta a [Oryzias melastigma]|uniref:Gonadotropin subunit beta-2 n=1 Tax=Oryzias melastigma TaxID=30732 RepID=A0A3B3C6T0_ORYME|nr:thyroid stimulating hormone subunit beta a [Oryzias melastigma]XP_024126154.1 thyroid stimulating hormone subunit beta a [Oryzias melastigma]
MNTSSFPFWGLLLLLSPVMPMCLPTDFTLYVEKPECDYCVAVNTTICTGFCYSRDSNMRDIFGPRFLIQRGCTYDKVEYRSAILPGCPLESNPVFTYPVALSCHCGACRTDSDECTHRASTGGGRCTKPVRLLHSYPGQSTYMILF